mmetsp:Transcript_6170/g.14227  ORF Transcript_6170/g.14227 Transcript_6170/m.14227 type:complete len:225 (+) Transcript_6170:253-927(+)
MPPDVSPAACGGAAGAAAWGGRPPCPGPPAPNAGIPWDESSPAWLGRPTRSSLGRWFRGWSSSIISTSLSSAAAPPGGPASTNIMPARARDGALDELSPLLLLLLLPWPPASWSRGRSRWDDSRREQPAATFENEPFGDVDWPLIPSAGFYPDLLSECFRSDSSTRLLRSPVVGRRRDSFDRGSRLVLPGLFLAPLRRDVDRSRQPLRPACLFPSHREIEQRAS